MSAVLALPLALAGCATATGATGPALTVTAGDSTCALSSTTAPAGVVTFSITNTGAQVTEFYVYDAAGTRILAEVENIGPGLTRALTTELAPGTVTTSCRPNGVGVGIRDAFTVTAGSGAPTPRRSAFPRARRRR